MPKKKYFIDTIFVVGPVCGYKQKTAVFEDNVVCRIFVNLETSEKIYKGGEYLDPMDGYVCFHNSDLVCGRLGKATLGGGNKSSLFQVIHMEQGHWCWSKKISTQV